MIGNLLSALALYFLLSAAIGTIRLLFRTVIFIAMLPSAVLRALGRLSRKAGARRLHPPPYFLAGEQLPVTRRRTPSQHPPRQPRAKYRREGQYFPWNDPIPFGDEKESPK